MCTGSHEALEKPLTQQQQGLENTPPPRVGNISQYHFGKKYEKREEKKAESCKQVF
jgi:hypothetical protein